MRNSVLSGCWAQVCGKGGGPRELSSGGGGEDAGGVDVEEAV